MQFINNNQQKGKGELKFIPIGGTTNVTKNLYVYEYSNDIIVVDCGIGFPDSDMLGVDVIVPDIGYLLKNREKVRGIIISHGHEDHFGALSYILPELPVPVYATELVQGFISNKLRDRNLKNVSQKLIDVNKTVLNLGSFEVSFFHTNHSVPESMGIVIKTPVGTLVHASDFKFDWTPVMGEPFDVARAIQLTGGHVLSLASDCLGALNSGYTVSERNIADTFNDLMDKAVGRQVLITTVSSNISRISQAIKASLDHGRKVVIAGRSLNQNMGVATKLGLLAFPQGTFVEEAEAKKLPQGSLTYLVAGAYGQVGSALWRIAEGEHNTIEIVPHAAVIFSADPIPGVHDQVDFILDRLTSLGADVYYSQIQENLHVSGHGNQGDLAMLAGILKPQYFIPIGGTIHHMRAYRNLIEKMGVGSDRIFELPEGQTLLFNTNGQAKLGPVVETKSVFVDGGQVGEIGNVVIRDRQTLSQDGILVISVPYISSERRYLEKVQLVSRGFVYVKESQELFNRAARAATQVIKSLKPGADFATAKAEIERDLSRFLFKQTGRNPIVLVSIVEV